MHSVWAGWQSFKTSYDDFNRKIADETLGTFKGDYIGLEVFREEADMLKPKVVDPFYKETMYVWKRLPKKYVVSSVKFTGKQHLF